MSALTARPGITLKFPEPPKFPKFPKFDGLLKGVPNKHLKGIESLAKLTQKAVQFFTNKRKQGQELAKANDKVALFQELNNEALTYARNVIDAVNNGTAQNPIIKPRTKLRAGHDNSFIPEKIQQLWSGERFVNKQVNGAAVRASRIKKEQQLSSLLASPNEAVAVIPAAAQVQAEETQRAQPVLKLDGKRVTAKTQTQSGKAFASFRNDTIDAINALIEYHRLDSLEPSNTAFHNENAKSLVMILKDLRDDIKVRGMDISDAIAATKEAKPFYTDKMQAKIDSAIAAILEPKPIDSVEVRPTRANIQSPLLSAA